MWLQEQRLGRDLEVMCERLTSPVWEAAEPRHAGHQGAAPRTQHTIQQARQRRQVMLHAESPADGKPMFGLMSCAFCHLTDCFGMVRGLAGLAMSADRLTLCRRAMEGCSQRF